MKTRMIGTVSFFVLLVFSSALHAEESMWDKAKKGASDAVEWTGEKAEKGWGATEDEREAVSEKGKKGWKATKKGAGNLLDKLAD